MKFCEEVGVEGSNRSISVNLAILTLDIFKFKRQLQYFKFGGLNLGLNF